MHPAIPLALLALAALPADAAGTAADTVENGAVTDAAAGGPVEFRTILGEKPIEIPAEQLTPAVEEFQRTGENPYAGDEAAIEEGRKLYGRLCQACHLPDGSGRIGPSLRDDLWRHPRLETEAGRFEIIHSGGAGAMQAFSHRIDAEEILKVMAYMDTFRKTGSSN